MRFEINGVPTEVSFFSMGYGEARDVMNGVYVDMPKDYIYLSDHVEGHREFMEEIDEVPMDHFNLEGCQIDWSTPPHSWILHSVERMIVQTAEQACIEACGE